MRYGRPFPLRSALAASIGLLAIVTPGPAAAQPEMSRALSRTAFEEGMRLYKTGAYLAACAKLEESLALDAQMGTRFWLADCYEHLGRTASAWSHFLTVASEAKSAGNATREATARARADALAPNLPRLVLVVPDAVRSTPGLEIARDGAVVERPLWGTPIPVDPGDHKLRASAPGKERWEATTTVGPSGAKVEIPPLRDAVEAAKKPALPSTAPVVGAPPVPAPPVPSRQVEPGAQAHGLTGWRRVAVPLAGTVGAAGVVAGSAAGALAFTTWHAALGLCDARVTTCAAGAQAKKQTASTEATVSDAGFAVGGAGVVAALIMGLTGPRGQAASQTAAVWVSPTMGGIAVGGAFR
jgi:hypothetical protein